MKLFKSSIVLIILLLIAQSCKSDSELTLERGNYFYSNKKYENAASEFKKIIFQYSDIGSLDNNEIEILAHAYQQLALSQAKLANQASTDRERIIDYQHALDNIKKAESLAIKEGKRSEYRKTRLGIEQNLK
tara:strand:+ start:403 stop:798 length:396 start_codon:yes stop_codon:yes gene_type:complete